MKNRIARTTEIILTITSIAQIILAFFFYNYLNNSHLCNIGWVFLWVSALFGVLPIITFKKYGGVSAEKSYIHTTCLVDKGIYSIVRHPQYLAGLLISIGLILITQHWSSLLLGCINIYIYFFSAIDEERLLLEKFGEQYQIYTDRVPRFNFLIGIIRHISRINKT